MSLYINSREKFSQHLDRMVQWKGGWKPAPVTVEWDLSNRCALGCMDCHFAHTHTRGPWVMKLRELPVGYDPAGDLADESLVRRALGEAVQAGVRGIVWSGGGEPTTHPRVCAIAEHAAELGLQQGMYTFGGLLTEWSALTLASYLSWVVVSLDAVDAATYATEKSVIPSRFDAACRGIRNLVAARRCVVGVSFLLHERNWHRCHEMVALARALGASYTTLRPAIRTSPVDPATCGEDRAWVTHAVDAMSNLADEPDVELDLDRFEKYRDWQGRAYHTCYGIRFNTTITPDGRVWVCPQRRGVPGSCVGDLRVESFRQIWDKHPGRWTDFANCRVMCRLHLMNETLATVYESQPHGEFL